MHMTIFHIENGGTEKWLEVNLDGSATYYEKNRGVPVGRENALRKRNMTAEEAKSDWPPYASSIDEALLMIAARKGTWIAARQQLALQILSANNSRFGGQDLAT